MHTLISLVIILLSASNIFVGASFLKSCEEDEECGGGFFCFPETKICTRCLQCKSYNRLDNSEDSCVKEPKDCGDCIDGYEEEKLTTGQFRELCTATVVHPPLANTTAPTNSLQWICGAVVLVIVSVFAIVILVWNFKPTIKARARAEISRSEPSDTSSYHCHIPPSAPPPSYETVATEERSFERGVYEAKESQNLLQASPFNSPQWVNNSPDDEQTSVDVVDGNDEMEFQHSVPELHDEETLPSTWSPGLLYNQHNPDTELVHSFTGLFSGGNTAQTAPPSPSQNAPGDGPANHSATPEEPHHSSSQSPSPFIVIQINGVNSPAQVVNNFGNS